MVSTHRNFISAMAGASVIRPARASPAVFLCTVPYFHVYGVGACMRTIALGASLVAMERFDVRLMMRGIEEFKVTHLALAPPTVVWMARDDNSMDGYDLSSLEVVGCGGAALQKTVIERFQKRFPRVQLAQVSTGFNYPSSCEFLFGFH